MSKAYKDWLDKIHNTANTTLVPDLREYKMIVTEEEFKSNVSYDRPYHLAGIQNFSGLIPVSQRLSKPIYLLSAEDGNWSGARWKRSKDGKDYGIMVNINDADMVYSNLSKSILNLTGG